MPDDQSTTSNAPSEPKPITRLKESVINKIAAGEVLPLMSTIPARNSVLSVDHSPTFLCPKGAHREQPGRGLYLDTRYNQGWRDETSANPGQWKRHQGLLHLLAAFRDSSSVTLLASRIRISPYWRNALRPPNCLRSRTFRISPRMDSVEKLWLRYPTLLI